MKAQRTVTHVAVIPEAENVYATVIAFCDDGTTWRNILNPDAPQCWLQFSSIPGTQPEPEA